MNNRGLQPGETPFTRRSCYDCGHLTAALSWWCGNEAAIAARGTRIPGCIHCTFWKPDWSMIDKEYKTAENGYKSIFDTIKDFLKP